MTRTYDAAVGQVWKAWSEPELVMRWWGPTGFTSPSARMDFRERGTSLVCMRAPRELGGHDTYNTWTYRRIVPLERLEFVQHFADKDGTPLDPAAVGLPPGVPGSGAPRYHVQGRGRRPDGDDCHRIRLHVGSGA